MINQKIPLVSVILPVHNNEEYLGEAIQSILNQTYTNFELLLLISGKTNEESLNVINSFSDPRIRRILRSPEENLPKALNKGIDEARGKYIARMDADDISLPERFARQVEYMETHPDISILGSWVKTFGARDGYIKHPTDPEEVKASLLFQTSVVHPTVIFRKSDVEKNALRYNPDFSYSEDADMWVRSAQKVKISNLPEILLKYRLHPKQATHTGKEKHAFLREKIKETQLEHIGIKPTEHKLMLHMMISSYATSGTEIFLEEVAAWLLRIGEANARAGYYDEKVLRKMLAEKWFTSCYVSVSSLGLRAFALYFQSPLHRWLAKNPRNIFRLVRFLAKSLAASLR